MGICFTKTRNPEDDTTVGETRIITDVCCDKNKKVWKVVVSIAKQHNYNGILNLSDNSNNAGDTIRITAGNNLSKPVIHPADVLPC